MNESEESPLELLEMLEEELRASRNRRQTMEDEEDAMVTQILYLRQQLKGVPGYE